MLKLSIALAALVMVGPNNLTNGSPAPMKLEIQVKPVDGQVIDESEGTVLHAEDMNDTDTGDMAADEEKDPKNPAKAFRQFGGWHNYGYGGR